MCWHFIFGSSDFISFSLIQLNILVKLLKRYSDYSFGNAPNVFRCVTLAD